MDDVASSPPAENAARARAALKGVFGYDSFRTGQCDVICAALTGRDCLAIMPTGAGKSVTYQLPSHLLPGCVLVVSPLVALMADQVSGAQRRGLRAASVDSTRPDRERERTMAAALSGGLDLLYCAPEGLPRVLDSLSNHGAVSLLAIDEAHCISEWGHDFRPAYRALSAARERLGVHVLAVTATATSRVADDITTSLGMRDPLVWRGTFFRPNLRLCALRKDRLADARDDVVGVVRAHEGSSGIVYCLSRRGAGALATHLRRRGIAAGVYHAGMPDDQRAEVQSAFASGAIGIVVATIAFGMGIDKADVRFVVHADMPGSIEAYAQEIGRAGRDGAPSDCVLLYSWADVKRRDALCAALPPKRRAAAKSRVREVYRFAASVACRHRSLCAHFGERLAPCGSSCDSCGAVSATALARGRRSGC
jgi:ATP-dependent DNA helicase RecQ